MIVFKICLSLLMALSVSHAFFSSSSSFALDFDKEIAAANDLSSALSSSIENPLEGEQREDPELKVQLISLSDKGIIAYEQKTRSAY